jgi:hypothetical protein
VEIPKVGSVITVAGSLDIFRNTVIEKSELVANVYLFVVRPSGWRERDGYQRPRTESHYPRPWGPMISGSVGIKLRAA